VTVADVIAGIDTATAGAVTASINSSDNGLQLSGTGPLTVADLNDGHTAQSLGLVGSTSSDLLLGSDIRTSPDWTTPLADIPALNGSLPLGEIRVEHAGTEYGIHLFATATLDDIRTLLQSAVPGLQVNMQGGVLSLVSSTTEPFTVTNADATNTASLLGLAGTGTPSRLFGVLADLKSALETHDHAAIRSRLAELEAVRKVVVAETIKVGGWENRLDWMADLLRQRDENLQASLSQEWDADVALVATELSKAQSAYEASLLITSRLFEVNLMDYLR
jgi:flagellin-like hook-associated protein FlgL